MSRLKRFKDWLKAKHLRIGYVDFGSWNSWSYDWTMRKENGYCCLFRNQHGKVIPGRWGFRVLGFEFGSRNPGDRVGVFLKKIGLWPW